MKRRAMGFRRLSQFRGRAGAVRDEVGDAQFRGNAKSLGRKSARPEEFESLARIAR